MWCWGVGGGPPGDTAHSWPPRLPGFPLQNTPVLTASQRILEIGQVVLGVLKNSYLTRMVLCLLICAIPLSLVNFTFYPKQILGGGWIPSRPWTEATSTLSGDWEPPLYEASTLVFLVLVLFMSLLFLEAGSWKKWCCRVRSALSPPRVTA